MKNCHEKKRPRRNNPIFSRRRVSRKKQKIRETAKRRRQ